MLRLIAQDKFVEGRWRNGMGVSWEIASYRPEGAADFHWRFAKARIDADVPFSIYPGMERVFMQLEGNGLDLVFEGGHVLQVHESHIPHSFACDVPLNCKLLNGPCYDLNLFTARGKYQSQASVLKVNGMESLDLSGVEAVFMALEGKVVLSGPDGAVRLQKGDAAIAAHEQVVSLAGNGAKVFVGLLQRG
ncbi:MAG: HutD family protein [Alphaproteobacteria bacterium]|nr:HutD family protein [Alphaproteobacteria bacterium]